MGGTACGIHPRSNLEPDSAHGDDILIDEQEIEALGASTAWEIVKRRAPQINYRENTRGEPTRAWRHGRSSVLLNDSPLLFVDGVRVSDLRTLEQIPAHTVATIRILTGLTGTTYYGTNAAGGVILVQTKT